MKKVLLTLLVAIVATTASGKVQFYELTQGSCWLKKEGKNHWKVATFDLNNAFNVSLNRFKEQVLEAVGQELPLEQKETLNNYKLDLSYHCSEVSPHFVASLTNYKGKNLCLKLRIRQDRVTVEEYYSNPTKREGLCTFYKPLEVTIGASDAEALIKQINQPPLSDDVIQIDIKRQNLTLTLREKWRFNENGFTAKLRQLSELRPLIKWIEYSPLYQVAGDAIAIEKYRP